jgi:hypothetical protein
MHARAQVPNGEGMHASESTGAKLTTGTRLVLLALIVGPSNSGIRVAGCQPTMENRHRRGEDAKAGARATRGPPR